MSVPRPKTTIDNRIVNVAKNIKCQSQGLKLQNSDNIAEIT